MGWQKRLQLHFCDTLREPHGLAMSSRNTRLSSTERNDAAIIYTLLTKLKASLPFKDIEQLRQDSITILEQKGYKVDYFDLADAYTLAPVINWDGVQKIVCLVAIFIGEVRLIDNMVLN
jgi:pantoate--beta-alanine ligase